MHCYIRREALPTSASLSLSVIQRIVRSVFVGALPRFAGISHRVPCTNTHTYVHIPEGERKVLPTFSFLHALPLNKNQL